MAWPTGDRKLPPQWPAQPPLLTRERDIVRASDAERDAVLAKLGDGFAAGRLSHETFVFRVEATLRAQRRGELDQQIADLPPAPRSRSPLSRARDLGATLPGAARGRYRAGRQALTHACRRPARSPALVLPAEMRRRYTIGRGGASDLSIGDLTVSRWHAELRRDSGGWRLADLGSMNGTRLNGWPVIGPVEVHPGDLVTFGVVTFVLVRAPAGAY
jgi:hypothetical protein